MENTVSMGWGAPPPVEKKRQSNYDFDYFVIGGGSGGLATAKAASKLQIDGIAVKVGLADHVKPSPYGTQWGIGGTCVNVGCIPKKLMHFAALMGEARHDQQECGFQVDLTAPHSWEKMQGNVGAHIKRLNWGYTVQLMELGIEVFDKFATFVDDHTILLTDSNGKTQTVTAEYITVAVGGRPRIPSNPGAEHVMTSDDLFWLKKSPGKTLVLGAGYVALECAGFLTGTGHDVTVLVRSKLLRGFDQDMTERIGTYMEEKGTTFYRGGNLKEIKKLENGRLLVSFVDGEGKDYKEPEEFDSVLAAIGRTMETVWLNLDKAGVKTNKKGEIIINKEDGSNVSNIFAIGDIGEGVPELTPVAIMSGKLLAKRLFGGSKQLMNYNNIVTAVFTPLEFGTVGLSEEEALKQYGQDSDNIEEAEKYYSKIDVYHTSYKPLEWNFLQSHKDSGYIKVVVDKDSDRVLGIHFLGPNAGEVVMGFGVAMHCGLTREKLFNTVGLHPTVSEEITDLLVTKREDANAQKEGC